MNEEEKNENENLITETLLDPNDMIIKIAPGEKSKPVGLFFDKDAEELSFPCLFAGSRRSCNPKLSYCKLIKSELRMHDRRMCRISKIFFSFKKAQIKRVNDSIRICLRKHSVDFTASDCLDDKFIDKLIQDDRGYSFLECERSSPVFWEKKKKEVISMLRQIGSPTFFMTLSAAETKWLPLLVALMKTVRNRVVTEEEAENLSYLEKRELISLDPVTCVRYFDYRLHKLLNIFKKANCLFGKHRVVDFYLRVEFQLKGSPHMHLLLWLDNTPVYNKNDPSSIEKCIEFIDEFICCKNNNEYLKEVSSLNLTSFQHHKHSFTCKKFCKNKNECRFGIPFPPMKRTMILEPLNSPTAEELTTHKRNYDSIKANLRERLKKNELNDNYEEFLCSLGLDSNEYINAIRYSLKTAKVFLKRSVDEIVVNNYHTKILAMQEANMDIQFILNPYACVNYIINYINKSEKGMSKLLRECKEEIYRGNYQVKDKLKIIANKFLNATEVTAQEACYNLLSQKLSECSRSNVFINTSTPENRTHLLKVN